MEVVLEMLFLVLSNANVEFTELGKLTWRFYSAAKTLPTISRVEFINKREFAGVVVDENSATFAVHIATLEILTAMPIHFSRSSQIQRLNKPTLAAL